MQISALSRVIVIVAAVASGPAWAASQPAAPIQFSDLGSVRSWRVGGDTVIFVKDKSEQWYKAEMLETCMKLDTTKGVKFITELDPETNKKFSAVVVDRHICHITSLTKVAAPPEAAK